MKSILVTISALALSCALPLTLMAEKTENTTLELTAAADNHPEENFIANEILADAELLVGDDLLAAEQLQELAQDDELAGQIIDYAAQYLGRPYRRGAKGPSAFDCSGFTSYVFKNFDIDLSASSRSQYTQGERIARSDIRPGDLLFFSGRAGGKTVGHVGLATEVDDSGRVKFIHASTSAGIRHDNLDAAYYARRFLGARRVLN